MPGNVLAALMARCASVSSNSVILAGATLGYSRQEQTRSILVLLPSNSNQIFGKPLNELYEISQPFLLYVSCNMWHNY